MAVNLIICWENTLTLIAGIEMKGREHSELQERNRRECLANDTNYEIPGLKLTADTVSTYHSVVHVREQGVAQQGGLW